MTSEPDFNAHIPGAPRAGCTAADRGQALWDVMTVFAGRRALGSVHADETRGGMEEIAEIFSLAQDASERIRDCDGICTLRVVAVQHLDRHVGERKDVLIYDPDWIGAILRKHGFSALADENEFLPRSLTEIFPLGSPERNAIDEMYGEDSQS